MTKRGATLSALSEALEGPKFQNRIVSFTKSLTNA